MTCIDIFIYFQKHFILILERNVLSFVKFKISVFWLLKQELELSHLLAVEWRLEMLEGRPSYSSKDFRSKKFSFQFSFLATPYLAICTCKSIWQVTISYECEKNGTARFAWKGLIRFNQFDSVLETGTNLFFF